MLLASEKGIPIIITNNKYEPEVFCFNLFGYHKLTKSILGQINWLKNPKGVNIARNIIREKIRHQGELVMYIRNESELEEVFKKGLESIDKSESIEEINKIEAIVARSYFKLIFTKSFKRFDQDEMNSALNYGYAIVRSKIKSAIISKGLHPSIGIWHHSQFNNYNLADDIIEIYRPMVDYAVYYLITDDNDFTKEERGKILLVLTQKVRVGKNLLDFSESLKIYVDSIIKFFNEESTNLTIPRLEIDRYEY